MNNKNSKMFYFIRIKLELFTSSRLSVVRKVKYKEVMSFSSISELNTLQYLLKK